MEVVLLDYTEINSLREATALPYNSKESNGLVKRVFQAGHRSIARHGMASFYLEGVSQSMLRQLSRHPHINLTVKSSRYCDMSKEGHYTPETLPPDKRFEFDEDMLDINTFYRTWKKDYEGDEKEVDVAKLFLPLGSKTDVIVSGNYQALYEMLQLRSCVRTEEEFRLVAVKMREILQCVMPEIFHNEFGCIGDEWHLCPESLKPCGKYITKKEFKESGKHE